MPLHRIAARALVLALALPLLAQAHAAACPTSAGMADASKHTKPSSFAPRPKPPGNAYGMPIGGKILTRPVRKKKTPAGPATPA
jgi:hypothetical protein